jgi:Carboxypeptidase regulatory-like domain
MSKILWTAIFAAAMLNAAGASSSSISGTVRDSEGAVIGKARIAIHRDPTAVPGNENADMVVTADNNGEFKLEVVPGFYDIFVSSPAFSPQCTKVRVLEAKPAIYNPRLRFDPLVSKEIGDRF